AGGTVPAGTILASVTDLIIDPNNSNRLLVGLGNIGLVTDSTGAVVDSTTAGVWRSTNKGDSWDEIPGGNDQNNPNASLKVPNGTIPQGKTVGRVTLGIGNQGRIGDESIVYVLVANHSGNNTPPNLSVGTFQGLYKSTDNLLNFTRVMLKQDFNPPAGMHNFVDINLGNEMNYASALLVDPTDANVVY